MRQFKRLVRDWGQMGDAGLVSRQRGRPSNSLVQREAAYKAALAALGVEAPTPAEGAGVGMGDEGYEVEAVQKRLGVLGYAAEDRDELANMFGRRLRATLADKARKGRTAA